MMIVLTLTVLSICIVFLTLLKRSNLTLMSGMMVAMASGMVMGLGAGVIAGILFKGDLFISTAIGACTGIIIGGLTGISVGIVGFLDGVLSGLMGGMMGAMLGEMSKPGYHEITTRLLFIFCLAISFLLFFIINHEKEKESKTKYLKVTQSPVIMTLVVGIIIFSSNLQGPIWDEHTDHSAHKGHSNSITNDPQEKVISIAANEFSYLPSTLTIKKGEKVTILLNNVGEVEHDLEIETDNVQIFSSSNQHNHGSNNLVHIHLTPKTEGKVIFTVLEAGTFVFRCTIPGHEEAGMKGTIKVM